MTGRVASQPGSREPSPSSTGLGPSGFDPSRCVRCAVLEDLLETARIQVENARREAEKADDEAVFHKVENLRLRANDSRAAYAIIKRFQRRAEEAEAKLDAIATETRRAETENTGSVEDEGAGRQASPKVYP